MNHPRAFPSVTASLAAACLLAGASAPQSRAATPPPAVAPAETIRIPSFRLPDQFGTEHAFEFPRTKPVLLLIGDRKGSEEVDAWITPLKERWGTVADIAGIADVSAAPRFLRSRITEGIRRQRSRPLMLDFEGKVTDPLRCTAKTANLLVLDPRGRVTARVTGTPDPVRLARVHAALEPWVSGDKPGGGHPGTPH